jgi:hypothetical protein
VLTGSKKVLATPRSSMQEHEPVDALIRLIIWYGRIAQSVRSGRD